MAEEVKPAAVVEPAPPDTCPKDHDVELRKIELEYGDKRDQRRADVLKWCIAAIWPAILAWLQNSAINTAKTEIQDKVAVVADANAATAVTAAKTAAVANKSVSDVNAATAKILEKVAKSSDDKKAQSKADELPAPTPSPAVAPDPDTPPPVPPYDVLGRSAAGRPRQPD